MCFLFNEFHDLGVVVIITGHEYSNSRAIFQQAKTAKLRVAKITGLKVALAQWLIPKYFGTSLHKRKLRHGIFLAFYNVHCQHQLDFLSGMIAARLTAFPMSGCDECVGSEL